MTKRPVMIRLLTTRYQIAGNLFEDPPEDDELPDLEADPNGDGPETTELWMEGRLCTGSQRVELVWEEGELSGMEGSVTVVGFERNAPGLISMMRSGPVSTAMTFEEGKRHFCVYDTPFSSFQVCVRALTVKNALLTDGELILEYLIEIHGAQAERCHMTISVKSDQPLFEETN